MPVQEFAIYILIILLYTPFLFISIPHLPFLADILILIIVNIIVYARLKKMKSKSVFSEILENPVKFI